MPTDTTWTWTILMQDGKWWHCPRSVPIDQLLHLYIEAGFHFAEIEAIIRH